MLAIKGGKIRSKSMWPTVAAIFFMTTINRARGGPWLPRKEPWIRYWETGLWVSSFLVGVLHLFSSFIFQLSIGGFKGRPHLTTHPTPHPHPSPPPVEWFFFIIFMQFLRKIGQSHRLAPPPMALGFAPRLGYPGFAAALSLTLLEEINIPIILFTF